jgi:MoaA/NifB/PqqE/SkfB family radical SAM enzyme
MRELPGLVPLAAKLGVDEVIFVHLDYLPNERFNLLRTFYHESPTPAFQESIDDIHRLGKKERISVKTYPLQVQEVMVCEPDPPRKVFFSVDGSVAPCSYLRLPKKGEIPRVFRNASHLVPQTIFGNINQEDFPSLWNQQAYQKFRGIFEDRRKAERDVVQMLDAFSSFSSSGPGKEPRKEPPPLSEVCQTCYKAYGI